jgi:DnaB-like helicase N terminal domain/AAA domain
MPGEEVRVTETEPYDLAAEQSVLGGMLLSKDAIADVLEVIRPADHYRPAHQLVHEAILGLYHRGDPVDAVAVGAELARSGDLSKVGGAPYLHTLISSVPTAANAGYYARIVADRAERRDWLLHGHRIVQLASDPAAELTSVRDIAGRQPRAGSSQAGLLAAIRNGSWLDEQDFPELQYAVPGLIPEGSTLLVGAPKIGKSWLVLGFAIAIASGGMALSAIKTGPPRPVLYLALEDGDRRMQDRCRQLLGPGEMIPPGLEYLTRVEPGQVVATVARWLTLHLGEHSFVIIDTLGKVMPLALQGESSYQRDYRVGSELKHLVDAHPGASLLTNHHDRKAAAADFIDSVSGTHGLAGAADTIVVLTRDRNEATGLLQVAGRDVTEGEYAVTFTGGSWALDGTSLPAAEATARTRRFTAGLSDRSAEVLELVGQHPHGIGATAVGEALGIDAKTAGVYLGRLFANRRIDRPSRGVYIPVGSVGTDESAGQALSGDSNTVGIVGSADEPLTSQDNTSNTSNTPVEAPGSHTGTCASCGEPLDPVYAELGWTVHAGCGDEESGQCERLRG